MGGGGEANGGNCIESLTSKQGFYPNDITEESLSFFQHQQRGEQHQSFSNYDHFDDQRFDMLSPPLLRCLQEISELHEMQNSIQDVEPEKKKQDQFSLTLVKPLKSYGNVFRWLGSGRILKPSNKQSWSRVASQELSTEEIMRIAGARFIQSSSVDVNSMVDNFFDVSFSSIPDEDVKKVELAELLLAAAEKLGNEQFDSARRLLDLCDSMSSRTGNPVERVVYYFSKSLRERIDLKTGKISSEGVAKKQTFDIDGILMDPTPHMLATYKEVPFTQVAQFAGIQAIVENVAEAKRIHVIDLGIRYGVQWTVLMQALVSRSECSLELLKITAIGTHSRQLIENTGKRLESFSQAIKLPFSFKIIMLSDMLDLKEDLFELDADETVAVYSEYLLRSLIAVPDRLESIMRVIRNINPCIMVVAEAELSTNSPDFGKRFIESLFFFSAYFDCLDDCMEEDEPNRMIIESKIFGEGIRNVAVTEGEERKRNVKIDVWRSFFTRFGMEETDLSSSSLFQAKLTVQKFACWSYCTLEMDGRSLLIGWKGTPIHVLSAWKFIP